MKFEKWHGCGNDFVLIDALDKDSDDFSPVAAKLCDRHYGVGADGVLVLSKSAEADFRMRIFNADGSEAEMCGNGIRCVARYAYDAGRTTKKEFSVMTGAGIMVPRLITAGDRVEAVEVDMGEPVLAAADVPAVGFPGAEVINSPLKTASGTFYVTCVSMGNPHCVIFVDDAENFPVAEYGSLLEKDAHFPRRTNVEFVEVVDDKHLRMRVWERGAAITLACGTGSCASLVAAALNQKTGREAELKLDGGVLSVRWGADNRVYMTGAAERVFVGECQ